MPGSPLSPPAVTALARTLSPNSTTATKLLPLVPYIFFVPVVGARAERGERAPARRGEADRDARPASSNGWTMSPVRRWKRLMSPHGVFQLPKSAASLSDAAASARSRCSRSIALPCTRQPIVPRFARRRRRWPISSPQNTASDVGTDDDRPARSPICAAAAICSASFAFSGLDAGSLHRTP